MQLSPSWEANISSACQENHRILWRPKVHQPVYKIPPLIPILSQMYPVYQPKHICWKSILIKLPHLHLGFPTFPLLQVSSLKPSMHLSRAPYLLHSPQISCCRFDCPSCVWWHIQTMKLYIMESFPIPRFLDPLKPMYTLHLYFCLDVRHQFSHSYEKAKLQFSVLDCVYLLHL